MKINGKNHNFTPMELAIVIMLVIVGIVGILGMIVGVIVGIKWLICG